MLTKKEKLVVDVKVEGKIWLQWPKDCVVLDSEEGMEGKNQAHNTEPMESRL